MRWRSIIVGLVIGGFVGFAGQWAADFFLGILPGRVPYEYLRNGGLELEQKKWRMNVITNPDGQRLFYTGIFLHWLDIRGDVASRTGAIAALLGASSVLAADELRKNSRLKKRISEC
jgi:hypothetical protein